MYRAGTLLLNFLLAFTASAMPLEEMVANERNTVELFQRYAPNVVYVHRLATYTNGAYQTLDVAAGSGSGFFWDKAGHIVTNYHVIHGADKLAVSIGQLTLPASVVGADPYKDIAVLKIEGKKAVKALEHVEPFKMAPTSGLFVGQKVLAIGNPFGLDHSLSVGVISALGRQVPGAAGVSIHNMIQTDAAINPGNSGGPLLDSQGHLLGLNTVIYSSSGSSSGVGFAVPSDDILRTVPELIKHGRIVIAGIGIGRVPPSVAEGLGVRKGVLIGDVLPGTPAAQAGLRPTRRGPWGGIQLGDIIIGLNGQGIDNYDALYDALSKVKVGETVKLTVLRGRQAVSVKLKTIDIGGY